jgi:hypothetical protein
MTLDPTWLILPLIPSGIGFVLFTYGKKQGRGPHLAAGVAMLVYPYFATTPLSLIGVGAAIGAALWIAVRAGW